MNMFSGVPGLVVMGPGTVNMAYRALRSAVRSDDPVAFFEHVRLYKTRGEVHEDPPGEYRGEAEILRPGKDVTVVSLMAMVPEALSAAVELSKEGIEVEVIDPCTIFPPDLETICGSIRRTHRLLVVQDWPTFGGLAAEVVAQADGLGLLGTPAVRLGLPMVPFPQAPGLGKSIIPNAETIATAVRSLVADR